MSIRALFACAWPYSQYERGNENKMQIKHWRNPLERHKTDNILNLKSFLVIRKAHISALHCLKTKF